MAIIKPCPTKCRVFPSKFRIYPFAVGVCGIKAYIAILKVTANPNTINKIDVFKRNCIKQRLLKGFFLNFSSPKPVAPQSFVNDFHIYFYGLPNS